MDSSSHHDVVVVGGGINGCAIARLAAHSGLRVALVEKHDFGSGITSRSTRLIHGGLRYLESLQFGLVRESLHDRELLLRDFPDQVAPQPFLVPVYASDSRPDWYIAVGLKIYQFLSKGSVLPSYRRLKASQVQSLVPGLLQDGLQSAFLFHDCQAIYPERLALEMALQAEEHGAVLMNHSLVTGFLMHGQCVDGVRVRTPLGDQELRCTMVVNAAGAWIDQLLHLLPDNRPEPLITLLNGSHIVVEQFPGSSQQAVYHETQADKRPFFVIPWRGHCLIGTTETPFKGDPDCARPTLSEVDYLLSEANHLFPGAQLTRESVLYTYCGSRPLLRTRGNNLNKASRGHEVYDHEQEDGIQGLLTMAGGKLTTANSFAREVLAKVMCRMDRPLPMLESAPAPVQAGNVPARIARLYGPRANFLQQYLTGRPGLDEPLVPGCETTTGEVQFAVEHEKAINLADIMLRRTGLAFEPYCDQSLVQRVAEVVANVLGWDESRKEVEVRIYQQELANTLCRI